MIVRVREALDQCLGATIFFLKENFDLLLNKQKSYFFFFNFLILYILRPKKLLDIVKILNVLLHFLLLIFSISYLYTTLCINCHNIA